ncbi:c-type cytochrome biogenesis protein CcmI [Rhodoferax sp.]|uniref:c-type cytochrome biogenesis protein CcmI n=1 Tax=Rhodoferax sp. TaxID=50421 RepID=UPI002761C1A3|nr:c-type cytochrome biogenesis protein CcmI [Rhodoferax sp.]
MTVFLVIAALLTLLVVGWLMRALLRPAAASLVSSQNLNISIYRDQLQALERDLARGAISAADYDVTRDELQLRMLDDTATVGPAPTGDAPVRHSGRLTALAVAILVPVTAAGMYLWLGQPAAMDPGAAAVSANHQVEQMVEGLAARLKANPNDPKGWAMLARSYKVMGRLDEAEQAFVKAGDVINSDAEMLVTYADLLAVRADHNIEGRPLALVQRALALDPQHPMGLMMAGVAAYRRADFSTAVSYWEKLLAVLPPGSPDATQIESNIAQAREQAGMSATPGKPARPADPAAAKLPPVDPATAGAVTPEKINQMVEGLAARLKSQPDDLAGWARLARAYKVMGRLDEAEQAFVKAGKLIDTDADLLTQYADLLAMRAGNQVEGRPMTLLNKALALNPKQPMALMMVGSAAFRRADFALAITHWEKALTVLEPGSRDATLVVAEIADARAKLGGKSQADSKP